MALTFDGFLDSKTSFGVTIRCHPELVSELNAKLSDGFKYKRIEMDSELTGRVVDIGVLGALGFMSVVVLFFWIERLLFFRGLKIDQYATREALELDSTTHLSIISSIGANAPYVGLLGTVLAVIVTFYTMGQSGSMDVKMIMTSLALALKATAMGLFVAIPAIFFYNHLSRKCDVVLTKWDIAQKQSHATKTI